VNVCEQLDFNVNGEALVTWLNMGTFTADGPISGNACVLAFSETTMRRLTILFRHISSVDDGTHSTDSRYWSGTDELMHCGSPGREFHLG
jgi:hypothetical protein